MFFIGPLQPSGLKASSSTSGIFWVASNIASSIFGKTKAEDATFEVLNKFSQITQVAKRAGTGALQNPLSLPILQNMPTDMRELFISNEEVSSRFSNFQRRMFCWKSTKELEITSE